MDPGAPQALVERVFAESLKCAGSRVVIVPDAMKMKFIYGIVFTRRVECPSRLVEATLALSHDIKKLVTNPRMRVYVSQPFFSNGNTTVNTHYLRMTYIHTAPDSIISRL